MKVELVASVEDFIERTESFREHEPLRTNVLGSVSSAVATGRSSYDAYCWWIIRDDDERVVGAAMRTAPFNMNLSPMTHDAGRALGHRVAALDDELPGIAGSKDVVRAVLEGYQSSGSRGSTRPIVERRRDLLYELEALVMPEAAGAGRPAREDDVDVLAEMMTAFMIEVDLAPRSMSDSREGVRKSVLAGTLFVWDFDGDVVSFAGHAPIVTTGEISIGRVGPVYTPPAWRGRGFASAVTAHVSRHLLERGSRVMLFTDAANPTSNGIYQAIGYRLIDELVEMRFASA